MFWNSIRRGISSWLVVGIFPHPETGELLYGDIFAEFGDMFRQDFFDGCVGIFYKGLMEQAAFLVKLHDFAFGYFFNNFFLVTVGHFAHRNGKKSEVGDDREKRNVVVDRRVLSITVCRKIVRD